MARQKKQSKGLGDTIEKITEATGIDCKCEERKEKLNNLISYRKKVNCLNESDYNQLTEFLKPNKGSLTPNEQWAIAGIYERVFNVKLESSNCSSCWREVLGELRKVYDTYND